MNTFKSIIDDPTILNSYSSRELVPLTCTQCDTSYKRPKNQVQTSIASGKLLNVCSSKCRNNIRRTKAEVTCVECKTKFNKHLCQIKKSKNNFCSKSCAGRYNTRNRKHGTRRSKIESWLEQELKNIYPDLQMYFNESFAIGSELDIFIPFLNLAFEINGIFHYRPIYGQYKLIQIQENDKQKLRECELRGINLIVIDVSDQKKFNIESSQVYLRIILDIINHHLQFGGSGRDRTYATR